MPHLLNRLLGRAYSYEDLLEEGNTLLSTPKTPLGLPDKMTWPNGRTHTFLELSRHHFKDFLKQIAEKNTKADQRTQLLSISLQELSWVSTYRAAGDAEYVESWAHFAKGHHWFDPYPKAEWKYLLLCRFILALICGSWITVLGRRLYQLEDYIQPALDLYVEYDVEIKKLHVNMFELIAKKLANYEDDEGLRLGKLTDEIIYPTIIKEQYVILDSLAADIKANTINIDFYKTEFARIDSIKERLGRLILALAIPED
jgi:hypothetical protein